MAEGAEGLHGRERQREHRDGDDERVKDVPRVAEVRAVLAPDAHHLCVVMGLYSHGLCSYGHVVMALRQTPNHQHLEHHLQRKDHRERNVEREHLYSYDLCSYGLYSYGLYSYGLYSYGPYSYGLYSYGANTTAESGSAGWTTASMTEDIRMHAMMPRSNHLHETKYRAIAI